MSREFLLIGISHRTAEVAVRERCSLTPDDVNAKLAVVMALESVREAWIVSTCNRTEVLVVTSSDTVAGERKLKAALREVLFHGAPYDAVYDYRGLQAVMHVFRVAAGLDSLVLGESQILAQVKAAFGIGKRCGAVGRLLDPMLQQALATAKRVRTETSVGAGTLSVARAGVDVAEQVFGGFEDNDVVILGAGETGRLAAKCFQERHVRDLCIVNRTLSRAEDAARELGCRYGGLEALSGEVARADVLVTALGGAADLVRPEHLPRRRLARRDQPLVIVDLSVPRAVSRDVSRLSNVLTYDLDDLQAVVDENRQERQRAGEEAAPILLADVHKFLGLRTYATYSPQIVKMRGRFEEIRDRVLDEVTRDASTPQEMKLAHRLSAQLLDAALDLMKETARHSVAPESLDEAYQRFLEEQG